MFHPEAHTLSATGKKISFRILPPVSEFTIEIMNARPLSQWTNDAEGLITPPCRFSQESNGEAPDPTLFSWSWHVALLVSINSGEWSTQTGDDLEFIIV